MGLDICILSSNGKPEKVLEIFGAHHIQLIEIITKQSQQFPLLSRMKDYYEDASYEPRELDDLLPELSIINQNKQTSKRFRSFINEFIKLCEIAKKENKGLEIIAD